MGLATRIHSTLAQVADGVDITEVSDISSAPPESTNKVQ